jgi:hypothetical protein
VQVIAVFQPIASDALFAATIAVQVTRRPTAKHPIVAGFHPRTRGRRTRREAQLEQFADSGGPGRHSMLKPEVVNHRQFFRRKHDLQSLTAEIVHGGPRELAFSGFDAKLVSYSIHSTDIRSIAHLHTHKLVYYTAKSITYVFTIRAFGRTLSTIANGERPCPSGTKNLSAKTTFARNAIRP